MKKHARFPLFCMVISLFGCLLLWQSPSANVATLQSDDCRAAYDDEATFDCLSGAARSMLENRFGKKDEGRDDSVSGGVATRSSELSSGPLTTITNSFTQILSALANPLVNNPASDTTARITQSETTLVLGSGMNVIAGFNDSGSFVPPGDNQDKFTGFSRSTDMGATWTDGGTLPTNPNGDAGDPVLARDNTLGRTYFSTLNFSGNGLRVFSSNDDGLTWNAPVNGGTGVGATAFQDKEWMTVDNAPGACQGNVYLAWRDFAVPAASGGIRFSRSTDNGATFGPSPGLLVASQGAFNVQGAFVAVGPDHAVYVFWLDQSAGAGTPNIVKVRKSTDCGLTFAASVNVGTLVTTGTNGSLGAIGGFRSNSFVQAMVNPTDANKVYVVHNDNPVGPDTGDVFLRQSTDGGLTWGAAVKVNSDVTTNTQFFPTIAVKPDGSGLAMSWYDRRRDPANSLIEYWGAIATISGSTVTFGPNFRISDPFPAVFGVDPVVNPVYMGDYDQMVADNSFFYVTWGDNQLSSAPDVRFAKIPMSGPGPVLGLLSKTVTGGDGDGIIERDECNMLDLTISNDGTASAMGIVGVLSTSTPGVTVTQPISEYPNLAPGASGTNTIPYKFSVSPSFICGTPIDLTLTLTYAGGSDVETFTLQTCQCPAPTVVAGSLAAGDPTQTGRLFRDGIPSACGVGKACSILSPSVQFRYDDHTFVNGGGQACVTVNVSTACAGANFIFAATYLGVFNPASICMNYLADTGLSPSPNASMKFIVPANASFDVVISEVTANAGCPAYNVSVSGLICATSGNGECTLGCALGHGYWKNHPEAWPVSSLTLGSVNYTQAQLLEILMQPTKGNGLVSLARQLIAARLNLASGAAVTPQVLQAIIDANALIDGLVIPPIGPGYLHPSTTSALSTLLDNYNNGNAPGGPRPCP